MTQRQVLRVRRRTDRVGLRETELADGDRNLRTDGRFGPPARRVSDLAVEK